MLTVRIDSPVPLNDQLVQGIRALIAAGTLRPGDELPPVRQLAADLGINLNTVARAYRELESDGLVSTARGRGTRITAALERPRADSPTDHVEERIRGALADAKLAGYSEEGARALLERMLSHFWNSVGRLSEPTNPPETPRSGD